MSRLMIKNQRCGLCTQRRLRSAWASAYSDWSLRCQHEESFLATLWVHSEDSDQTGQMPRLIWVFAGHTFHFVGFDMRQLIFYFLPLSDAGIIFFFLKVFKIIVLLEPYHEKICLMPYADNKGADQLAHPHSLISPLVVRCLDSTIPVLAKIKILSLS